MKKMLFRHEVEVLELAKKRLTDCTATNGTEMISDYCDLVKEYEKLLKMTMKTYKISDIQGKMLKKQEAEITRVNNNLKKVEESRKHFISDISHEMGAPIRAILSFLKIIVDGKAELEPKYIQLMYERITTVNDLIKDLFDLSILEVNGATFTLVKFPINGLIQKLFSKYEIDVKAKGIQFKYEDLPSSISASGYFINIDFARIEQVMTNLINNAIKFTPSGGTITVSVELGNDREITAHKIFIKIIDTGSGIGKEMLPYIFDRFYKGNQHESGTGLGLAISKEIILKHQEMIEAISELNRGSTFIITLPIYLEAGEKQV
ncbi:MAG TPA: HAMP domain-containing histidine kinase [Bacillus bacterium]|nr:HAMP domain-containing histidine kinase [Bacillus sp. (in: firmicutes)]